MSSDLDQVRQEVACSHGLGPEAATFIAGESLAELEESAARLAGLVERHDPGLPSRPVTNVFAQAAAAKQGRKEELHRLFTGKSTGQPRDERGRFTLPPTFGFDGGARPNLVPPPPLTAEQALAAHGQWLAQVIAHRRADLGIHF